MQDWMDPQMRTGRRRIVELVPEFRRLVANIPMTLRAAQREHPLLRARRFFVAPDAGEQAIETVLGECELEALGLARGGSCGGRQGRIDRLDRRTELNQQIEAP